MLMVKTGKRIEKAVRDSVDTDAEMVIADQLNSYNQLTAECTIERIKHVRDEIRTNGVESL